MIVFVCLSTCSFVCSFVSLLACSVVHVLDSSPALVCASACLFVYLDGWSDVWLFGCVFLD